MIVTKIYCDHCEKELDEMKDYIEENVGIYEVVEADLCEKCFNELRFMIKNFCNKNFSENT